MLDSFRFDVLLDGKRHCVERDVDEPSVGISIPNLDLRIEPYARLSSVTLASFRTAGEHYLEQTRATTRLYEQGLEVKNLGIHQGALRATELAGFRDTTLKDQYVLAWLSGEFSVRMLRAFEFARNVIPGVVRSEQARNELENIIRVCDRLTNEHEALIEAVRRNVEPVTPVPEMDAPIIPYDA